jgi:DNA polymerase I-like protein with 3'-5' exonuclease and polymerase domains
MYVIDIETDNLLDNITKIHCLYWYNTASKEHGSITEYSEIIKFLNTASTLIGHNCVQYDVPALEKVLSIKVKCRLIDTLGLSWTLFPQENKHSLEHWGENFNIQKVQIDNWDNLDVSSYILRCKTDVQINTVLWYKIDNLLNQLYDNQEDKNKYIDYISFKLDCLREQETTGVTLDTELCYKELLRLSELKEHKIQALIRSMPKVPVMSLKRAPKVTHKADGSPSTLYLKYQEALTEFTYPPNTTEFEYISSYKEPNPNSHDQIKTWLYSLGWIPEHIKHFRDKKKNEIRKIPQIKHKTEEGEICDSIKKLIPDNPELTHLNGLFVLSHRISVLKGFLRDSKNGKLYQGSSGLTNTLRLQHTVLVNLPSETKLYAENIRKCLISENNKVLIGSDLVNIETKLRDHFIYPYDKEYVLEMQSSDFDSHLDIAKLAGFLTDEQVKAHKSGTKKYKDERHKAKQVNFSAQYGVSPEGLSRNSGLSLEESEKLLEVYWKRNWAIKEVSKNCTVKSIGTQKWLYNPIIRFWYSLRAEKDRVSTLIQGSAVYVFDLWLRNLRAESVKISFQIHDEFTTEVSVHDSERTKELINKSINKINKELQLNVLISCDIKQGNNYLEAH